VIVLRAVAKEPESLQAVLEEIRRLAPRFVHPGRGLTGGPELLDAERAYLEKVIAVVAEEKPRLPIDPPAVARAKETLGRPFPPSIWRFATDGGHLMAGGIPTVGFGPGDEAQAAISLDPHFPELAQGLVFMGGSLNPQSDDPEFANTPRHEFNIWFDPEAAHIVLRAPWKKIVCTPVDISIKTRLSPDMVKKIGASGTNLAHYLTQFYKANYMWDELAAAAWLDPSLITKKESRFMSVDIDHGAGYGNTLIWNETDRPRVTVQPVIIIQAIQRTILTSDPANPPDWQVERANNGTD